MKRYLPFPLITLVFALLVVPSLSAAAQRPNILLIVADDLGYGELSCQGNPQIPTPHIDSLAKSGVRFTSGYVSGPYCSPTRAALMTGRYQQRYGHEFNPGPPNNRWPISACRSRRRPATGSRPAGYARAGSANRILAIGPNSIRSGAALTITSASRRRPCLLNARAIRTTRFSAAPIA